MLLCSLLGCNHSYSIGGEGSYRGKRRLPQENSRYLQNNTPASDQVYKAKDISENKDYRFHTRSDYTSEYSNLPEPKIVYLQHDEKDNPYDKKKRIAKKPIYKTPTKAYQNKNRVIEIKPKKTNVKSTTSLKLTNRTELTEMPKKSLSEEKHKKLIEEKDEETKLITKRAKKLKPITIQDSQPRISLTTKKLKSKSEENLQSPTQLQYSPDNNTKSKDIDKKLQDLLDEYDRSQQQNQQLKKESKKVNPKNQNNVVSSTNNNSIETYDIENKPIPLPFE